MRAENVFGQCLITIDDELCNSCEVGKGSKCSNGELGFKVDCSNVNSKFANLNVCGDEATVLDTFDSSWGGNYGGGGGGFYTSSTSRNTHYSHDGIRVNIYIVLIVLLSLACKIREHRQRRYDAARNNNGATHLELVGVQRRVARRGSRQGCATPEGENYSGIPTACATPEGENDSGTPTACATPVAVATEIV